MNTETSAVLAQSITILFQELNQGNADNPKYRVQHDPERKDIAFSIAEKAPAGTRFPDGQNWKRWMGPSWRQCEQIAATSHTVAEIVHRWKQLIFEGIDTTRMLQPQAPVGVSEGEFNQKVDERVQAILKEHLAKLQAVRNDQELGAVARAPVEEPAKGLQVRKAKNDNQNGRKRLELWAERAKLLGIDGPTLTRVGNKIHKGWLNAATRLWDAYMQTHPEAPAPEPAPATAGSA